MPNEPRILAFAGSLRRDSFNKRLVRVAAEGARSAGAEVTVLDLADYPLPVFNEDLERDAGTPQEAIDLKAQMVSHDGFLIASPEYNSSISGALKNAIDWASRHAEGEPGLVAFSGKCVALMAASPGSLGGLRGLVHVRSILGNLGMLVLPKQVAVPSAHKAFDDDGGLVDPKRQEAVKGLGRQLAELLGKLA